uniref:prealbumin-like fold domain-containing protein n=1 Tax=Bifidobacterium adolescentis TaxID=1680 RepID=UPI003D7AD247
KDLRDFAPSDLKMPAWKAGRYWYDVEIPAQDGVDDAITLHGLTKDTAKESWIVAEPTAGLTTKTDAPAGLTDLSATPVHDTVTAKTTGYPAGSTFDATLTLNYRAADGTTAKARAVTFKAAVNGSTKSPDIAPSAFSGWTKWKVGHYWFDLTAVDPNGKTITVNGSNDPNEQFGVGNHTTKATLAITTQAAKGTASTTNADPVHDTIRLSAAGAALTVARVHVRLNYPKADGTTATAVKDTEAVTVPANGVKSIDSPTFTPADLGLGGLWADNAKASDHYWFDVWVDKADATLSGDTGVMALSGALTHDGKADAAEQFRLDKQSGKATTTAAGMFDRAGGMAATHDTLHLAFPGARILKVTSTLHYAADAAAVKADASKAKTATVAANGDVAGPAFTPADFGWSSWKAGHYWYDLDIPAQSGYNALAVDGLTDRAEQWTAVVPFALDLAKLAYIGQPGQGRWSNEPVKGAVFTLTETTDASGSAAKPGASPRTVTTDADGAAHLLDGVIGATGDRWFRLAETKAPASYALPSAGTYWMVRVSGGADKASVTVSGSNAEAKALLKGLDGSTVTVGNRLEGNIMPPMTGGRYDVARAGALAGAVTLGLLVAGCVVLRRRNASPLDR